MRILKILFEIVCILLLVAGTFLYVVIFGFITPGLAGMNAQSGDFAVEVLYPLIYSPIVVFLVLYIIYRLIKDIVKTIKK